MRTAEQQGRRAASAGHGEPPAGYTRLVVRGRRPEAAETGALLAFSPTPGNPGAVLRMARWGVPLSIFVALHSLVVVAANVWDHGAVGLLWFLCYLPFWGVALILVCHAARAACEEELELDGRYLVVRRRIGRFRRQRIFRLSAASRCRVGARVDRAGGSGEPRAEPGDATFTSVLIRDENGSEITLACARPLAVQEEVAAQLNDRLAAIFRDGGVDPRRPGSGTLPTRPAETPRGARERAMRWLGRLAPALDDPDALLADECRDRLRRLAVARDEGPDLVRGLERESRAEDAALVETARAALAELDAVEQRLRGRLGLLAPGDPEAVPDLKAVQAKLSAAAARREVEALAPEPCRKSRVVLSSSPASTGAAVGTAVKALALLFSLGLHGAVLIGFLWFVLGLGLWALLVFPLLQTFFRALDPNPGRLLVATGLLAAASLRAASEEQLSLAARELRVRRRILLWQQQRIYRLAADSRAVLAPNEPVRDVLGVETEPEVVLPDERGREIRLAGGRPRAEQERIAERLNELLGAERSPAEGADEERSGNRSREEDAEPSGSGLDLEAFRSRLVGAAARREVEGCAGGSEGEARLVLPETPGDRAGAAVFALFSLLCLGSVFWFTLANWSKSAAAGGPAVLLFGLPFLSAVGLGLLLAWGAVLSGSREAVFLRGRRLTVRRQLARWSWDRSYRLGPESRAGKIPHRAAGVLIRDEHGRQIQIGSCQTGGRARRRLIRMLNEYLDALRAGPLLPD